MRIHWGWDGDSCHAVAADPESDRRFHLLVEPIIGKPEWDWVVWQNRTMFMLWRHGTAASAETAMRDAEHAVRHWNDATSDCEFMPRSPVANCDDDPRRQRAWHARA